MGEIIEDFSLGKTVSWSLNLKRKLDGLERLVLASMISEKGNWAKGVRKLIF